VKKKAVAVTPRLFIVRSVLVSNCGVLSHPGDLQVAWNTAFQKNRRCVRMLRAYRFKGWADAPLFRSGSFEGSRSNTPGKALPAL
jgi:hypothetical protein